MSSAAAAFLEETGKPLVVKPVPYPMVQDDEILIKVASVAINPFDGAQQMMGPKFFPFMQFPCVLGEDVAGVVEAVGAGVTGYQPGDRVAALARRAFQTHVTTPAHLAIRIPDALAFEQAAVLPLALSIAVVGLFGRDYLALPLPAAAGVAPAPTGKAVLIWGGSTSVGCNAIQLAAAAGYEVITTASPANFDLVKGLGARQVFDHNSPTIKDDLVAALNGKEIVGAIANGAPNPGSHAAVLQDCAEVVRKSEGRKFLACTMMVLNGPPEGVEAKFIQTFQPGDKDLALASFGDFVPKALAAGSFVASPKAHVAAQGLEGLQDAINYTMKGVSATKVVVNL